MTRPPKHLVVDAPERLRVAMAHAGYRVRLYVERLDGSELGAYHQNCIPAIVAGYQADERRPEVAAAEVDTMALLDELLGQEQGANPPEPQPADPPPDAPPGG